MIRLDFPGFSGAKSLQPISWNEWFRQFDENNLALLVQETTSRGQRSNFNRLVSRDTVARRKCAAGRRRTTTRRATRSTRTAAGGRATRTSR